MNDNVQSKPSQIYQKFTIWFFDKQDGSSLAVFRILIGLLLMSDVLNKFKNKYTVQDFKPTYYGFDWVYANQNIIDIFIALLPYTIFFIIVGLFYRLAMPLTALMIGYLFLAFPEHYLNHYYLLLLYLIIMSFIPANATWSLDSLLRDKKSLLPSRNVPRWCYLILKLQTEIMLIFAGLVKINPDWLNLIPLIGWIKIGLHDAPLIGWLFLFDTTIAIGAYSIIILHVLGAPLLFWKRTRIWIFSIYVCFHLTNSFLFHIGIFPFLTIVATMIFFNPDWPRKFTNKLKLSVSVNRSQILKTKNRTLLPQKVTIFLFSSWILIQILVPFSALFYSNIEKEWNGHRDQFTWRMMLNERSIKTVVFAAHFPENNSIEFISLKKHLSPMQCYRIAWSDITVQFAKHLKEIYDKKYNTDTVRIHAYIVLRVNLRETELWTDPTLDISEYKPVFGVHEWINPLTKPLRTWDEYLNDRKYTAPTYGEVLAAMNIPYIETVTFERDGLFIDTTVPKPFC
ncbi:MAG: HTTM domain-containing protein [Alphaproteobacteria bacterium]